MSIVMQADLPLKLHGRGKVRDTYEIDGKLLIVATDRISAFDVVLPCAIPLKGLVLNQISCFWFEKTKHITANHLVSPVDKLDVIAPCFPPGVSPPEYLLGRSMVTLRASVIPLECVVRGYLSGSAWAEYRETGSVSGISLPEGLQESQKLSRPIFTPTTKAVTGHDQPLTKKEAQELVGKAVAQELEEKSLTLYRYAHDYARDRDIIIADTKFEFGLVGGKVILVDEVLTPDSSRFWDARQYTAGQSQPSFDKQMVRDWLAASGWNKEPPAPSLPEDIIKKTTERYVAAYRKLVGKDLPQQFTRD